MAVRDELSNTRTNIDTILLRFVIEHVGLVLPFAGALIFFCRCVVVSRGNRYTAILLMMQTSIGDALRALLLPAVWLLLIAVWVGAAYSAFQRASTRKRDIVGDQVQSRTGLHEGINSWMEPGTLLRIAVSFASYSGWIVLGPSDPTEFLWFPLPIAALVCWSRLRNFRERKSSFLVHAISVTVSAMVVGLMAGMLYGYLTGFLSFTDFWLPMERLLFKGDPVVVGYVLSASEDQFVILQDEPRIIIEKPKADLLRREVCYPPDYEAQFKASRRTFPDCPSP